MTYQKAISAIMDACNWNGSGQHTSDELAEAKRMVCEAAKKQIPKKPIHIHEEYDKHDWHKKSDGTVDDFYWDSDIHSGVQCKRCGEIVCTLCHEDYDEEAGKCVIDKHLCPNCKRGVGKFKHCPDCGQALDWSDTE